MFKMVKGKMIVFTFSHRSAAAVRQKVPRGIGHPTADRQ
jgi:hypothetical protein